MLQEAQHLHGCVPEGDSPHRQRPAVTSRRTGADSGPGRAGRGRAGRRGLAAGPAAAGGDWLPRGLCSAAATAAGQRKFERGGARERRLVRGSCLRARAAPP